MCLFTTIPNIGRNCNSAATVKVVTFLKNNSHSNQYTQA